MEPPSKAWSAFFAACFQRRIRADGFDAFATELHGRFPLPGPSLAALLLRPLGLQQRRQLRRQPKAHGTAHGGSQQQQHQQQQQQQQTQLPTSAVVDPLILVYLDRLLAAEYVNCSDVLYVLLWLATGAHDEQDGHHHGPPKPAAGVPGAVADGAGQHQRDGDSRSASASSSRCPPDLEEHVFFRLAKCFTAPDQPRTVADARRVLILAARWMSFLAASDSMQQAMAAADGIQHVQPQSAMVREAFGTLLLALTENQRVVGVLTHLLSKEFRQSFGQNLSLFIPFLAQTSIQISNRLEVFQKEHGLGGESINDLAGTAEKASFDAMQLEAILDLPAVNTRAGMYIFLSSLLAARPLTDDHMVLNYLNMRYKGDVHSLIVELITGSFDILANGMYRNESPHTMSVMRSFLVNKVPLLLTVLSQSMFPPLTAEYCITQALSHVDPNTFPPPSGNFNFTSDNSSLSDMRQDFLFACCLHQLIPEDSIERLLGEAPLSSLPAGGKYVKETLVAQCSTNPERVEELLNELESFDGNAGAIVGAVTEIIRNFCSTKETLSLKSICYSLSRKPQSLDVMMQFTSPASILQPLCQLLDSWKCDDDQGEYQPVYDEFGAVLLLVLAFVHRYDLSSFDIGLDPASFVSQFLDHGHLSIPLDSLTEDQNKHLGGWLKGLFEGIEDELMSTCRPQEFYMLVPTLMNQILFACSEDVLSLETVKGGLEFLLETFLLPSLVSAISWMATHALETSNRDLDILVQIINKLVQPTSISGDAQIMHGTILAIVSSRLDKCMRTLRRRTSNSHEIDTLLQAIKPHLHYERSPYSSIQEIETWTSAPGSNMRLAVKNLLQSLVTWSIAPEMANPPSYSHRQFFTATNLNGAHKVLGALLEETKTQTETGNGSLAIDVASSLICAPSADNSPVAIDWLGFPATVHAHQQQQGHPTQLRTRLNLRDALRGAVSGSGDAASLLARDPGMAEALVRLHRRVEAQLAPAATAVDPAAAAAGGAAGLHDIAAADVAAQMAAADVDIMQGMDDMAGLGGAAGDAAGAGGAAAAEAEDLERQLEMAAAGGADDGGAAAAELDAALGIDSLGGDMDAGGFGVLGDGDDDIFAGLDDIGAEMENY
ncbi:mediator complex, subunit Med5 [Lineolata rhizophorae]|uniref:Mediator of RNA polymerase II transcription subunit 5 n=1 Tax=Lineolata rhizophorae TaxID=578093 RepID=A0A6A6PCE7_9PEZI|nr:mediator complex, subunit Med5 [Lineolata rhizophorae]